MQEVNFHTTGDQKKQESLIWDSHIGFKGRWNERNSGTCQLLGLSF